jgi:hypothetical protein
MDTQQSALLLIGSAKRDNESTSAALGGYLLDQLGQRGFATTTEAVHRALRTEARTKEMLAAVDGASIVLLSFPLYVDTLPYLVTEALEKIADHRREVTPTNAPRFVAIANCGFPEAEHCALALDVCAQFAQQAALHWAGGLAMGAGGAVNGQRPTAKGMTHSVAEALDCAAAALACGEPLPEAAIQGMARPLMPHSLYLIMGNLGWHMMARQNHAWTKLGARPLVTGDR